VSAGCGGYARRVLDRHGLYELCVQSPRHVVNFLRGVHGGKPVVLREDFCGTGAVARRWVEDGEKAEGGARAVGVDLDEEVLARGTREAMTAGIADRVRLVRGDAVTGADEDGADVIFVGNFSIGEIHQRGRLIEYLRRCRDRLAHGNGGFGGGVFVCDTYGGAGAWRLGNMERTHIGRNGEVVKYLWEHEVADPMTGMVRNSISFRVIENGELTQQVPRAFVYEWRLWSIAELTEAMLEAGFASVAVHKEVNMAPGEVPRAVAGPRELGEDWIVLVVGRG